MSEPFVLRPADIKEPWRRWQLVDSLAQPGDRVLVEFFDDTGKHYRITGTYLGKQHSAETPNTVRNGDTKTIVVVADTFTWYSRVNTTAPVTWPGGTCADTAFVIPTTNLVSIENIDGPVDEQEIDAERLKDALYHAVADLMGPGTAATPTFVEAVIRNYERD